ncbi:Profilin [compost metagenome]
MNSWQSYVDVNLMGAGLTQAAITGHDGQIWACSAGFALTQEEVVTLLSRLELPLFLLRNGFVLGGGRFFTLSVNSWGLLGRCGSGGCICIKTPEEFLIGVYDEHLRSTKAVKIVETFADYLRVLSF